MAAGFFERFNFSPVTSADLDARLAQGTRLTCLYLWGEQCFNCDQFKAAATIAELRFAALDLDWLHTDVYSDAAMGRRFALHGVPAFYFFRQSRKLGRVTGWPGIRDFAEVVEKLNKTADNP